MDGTPHSRSHKWSNSEQKKNWAETLLLLPYWLNTYLLNHVTPPPSPAHQSCTVTISMRYPPPYLWGAFRPVVKKTCTVFKSSINYQGDVKYLTHLFLLWKNEFRFSHHQTTAFWGTDICSSVPHDISWYVKWTWWRTDYNSYIESVSLNLNHLNVIGGSYVIRVAYSDCPIVLTYCSRKRLFLFVFD